MLFDINAGYFYINGEGNPVNAGEGSSGNCSGGNPGGTPNPQDTSGIIVGGGLPRDESNNTLGSNMSHTIEEYTEAKAAELQNVSNIMDDPRLSNSEKKERVLVKFTRLINESVKKDSIINELKTTGKIPILLDKK